MIVPVRGQVFMADIGYGEKPWVVVSNNGRNKQGLTVLAARLTTTERRFPTAVRLENGDGLSGYVLADDLEQIHVDELGRHVGALSVRTMLALNEALKIALAIP